MQFYCDICNYNATSKFNFRKHQFTLKHHQSLIKHQAQKQLENTTPEVYQCPPCSYSTTDKSNYRRHFKSVKHAKLCKIHPSLSVNCTTSSVPIIPQPTIPPVQSVPEKPTAIYHQIDISRDELVTKLLMRCSEMQSQLNSLILHQNEILQHQCDKLDEINIAQHQPIINIQTNIQNNVKQNLNLFLESDCKQAMNMSEFIDSLDYSIESVVNVAHVGYVDGIAKLFNDKITELGILKRPIHCTDLKREVIYIKNNDKWDKDIEGNLLKKYITKANDNNIRYIKSWKELNPEADILDTPEFNLYMDMVRHSMNLDTKNDDKIVKNLCNTTKIMHNRVSNIIENDG